MAQIDGSVPYRDAVGFAFKDGKVKHIAKAGIGKKPDATNNRIERLNGTVRERTKVQRGWKTLNTPLAEGARIHYNFVRPHQALKGQTPAEKAEIGVEGVNKWMTLLERATRSSRDERTSDERHLSGGS